MAEELYVDMCACRGRATLGRAQGLGRVSAVRFGVQFFSEFYFLAPVLCRRCWPAGSQRRVVNAGGHDDIPPDPSFLTVTIRNPGGHRTLTYCYVCHAYRTQLARPRSLEPDRHDGERALFICMTLCSRCATLCTGSETEFRLGCAVVALWSRRALKAELAGEHN
jgi:hypothetical protein